MASAWGATLLGCLGAEPQAGSRAEPLVQGVSQGTPRCPKEWQ